MIELGHPYELLVAVIHHLTYCVDSGYHLLLPTSTRTNYDNSRGPIVSHALGVKSSVTKRGDV
jgi:hypothetical protein